MADKRLSNIQGGWSSAGVVMGDSVFSPFGRRTWCKISGRGTVGVKVGKRRRLESMCLHVYMTRIYMF